MLENISSVAQIMSLPAGTRITCQEWLSDDKPCNYEKNVDGNWYLVAPSGHLTDTRAISEYLMKWAIVRVTEGK